jgi:hypothetical protein
VGRHQFAILHCVQIDGENAEGSLIHVLHSKQGLTRGASRFQAHDDLGVITRRINFLHVARQIRNVYGLMKASAFSNGTLHLFSRDPQTADS